MAKVFILALIVTLNASTAESACEWKWVCDGSGNCSNVPICDSAIDVVPPQPPFRMRVEMGM